MFKKWSLLAILVFVIAAFSACGGYTLSDAVDGAAEKNRQEEETIAHSYVGSYVRNIGGVMGTLYGGHLINLYNDGTVKINYAAYGTSPMVGSQIDAYTGTYTMENDALSIVYTVKDEQRTVNVTVTDGQFRGLFQLGMKEADDKSDENNPGLNYFEIPKTAITNSGRAFYGAVKTESGFCAQVLELNHESEDGNSGKFAVTVASSDCVGEFGGTFRKDGTSLAFLYDVPEVSERIITDGVAEKDCSLTFNALNEYVTETAFNIGGRVSELKPTLIMGKN